MLALVRYGLYGGRLGGSMPEKGTYRVTIDLSQFLLECAVLGSLGKRADHAMQVSSLEPLVGLVNLMEVM